MKSFYTVNIGYSMICGTNVQIFQTNTKQFDYSGMFSLTRETRWYPRGIQKLVSTYELHVTQGRGCELGWSKLIVPSPVRISIGGVYWGSQNSKCQVLSKFQFVCGEGGNLGFGETGIF